MPPVPATPVRAGVEKKHAQGEAAVEIEKDSDGSWTHMAPFSPAPSGQAEDRAGADGSQAGDMESETTEEDSEQSTSDSDVEQVEQRPLVVEDPALNLFINEKSLVIHREKAPGLLKCGRKVSPHFMVVYELNGIRCSRCFDV